MYVLVCEYKHEHENARAEQLDGQCQSNFSAVSLDVSHEDRGKYLSKNLK